MKMEMAIERRFDGKRVIVTTKEVSMMMSTACGGPDAARLAGIIDCATRTTVEYDDEREYFVLT